MRANGVSALAGYARSMLARIALLVTLVACNDPEFERLTAIKSKVCACKTASCAEQEMKHVLEHPTKSTRRTQGLARDMFDCAARLQDAERPTTDPDELDVNQPVESPTPGSAGSATSPRSEAPASARKP